MTRLLVQRLAKVVFYVSCIILVILFLRNMSNKSFFIDYLTVFSYFISASLAACFFVLLHYLSKAGWSTIVKRVPDHLMSLLPFFALLFVPLLFGVDFIFEWLDVEKIKYDYLIKAKLPYLNLPFFVARNIFYFAVFSIVSIFYWRSSIKQDTANQQDARSITKKLQSRSAISILLMSLTTSFASFDWLMSLYSHWFSTVFGVYYFAGGMVFFLALTIIIYELLAYFKITSDYPNIEHFHDLTKLLYGFMVFWAYISFSQYFLTWYANIPEFTQWYYPRTTGDWNIIFFALAIFHFIIPLFAFMSRHVKRNRFGRVIFASMMIVIHYVDVRFLVYPNFVKNIGMSSIEITLIVLFTFILGSIIVEKCLRYNALPVNDPRLDESKTLENAL